MNIEYSKSIETAKFILDKIDFKPEIAIILGSGLGAISNHIENQIDLYYNNIPNFPVTTVHGHEGKLICGYLSGKKVVAMKGRFHYYEGNEIEQVVFPVRVFRAMGIETLIITNAAGGLNKNFKPGTLMLIKDHLSFFSPSPLRGENIDEFGSRFPDMGGAYDKNLIDIAQKAAMELEIKVEEGVYAFMRGPMYETHAEIRALSVLGSDAVGMSTVPEVITAKHAGIRTLGISCITNMAAGILDTPLNHSEVIETATFVEEKFIKLVKAIIYKI